MFVFLSTTALLLGVLALYSSSVPKLPIWLRIANIVVGLGFTGLGIWSIFMVGDSVKVVFPTPLYILPILSIIASSLYQWNVIHWGLDASDKPVRIAKVRPVKVAKPAKVKPVKEAKKTTSQKVDTTVEETKAASVKEVPTAPVLPPRTETPAPVKPSTPKTITTSDGFDLKLPDLF